MDKREQKVLILPQIIVIKLELLTLRTIVIKTAIGNLQR